MLATKAALASGAITHWGLRWGWRMFFERPPDRVVTDAPDDLQLDDFLLQKTQRPSGLAGRGRSASQSDQLGFRGAVENPARGRFGIVLARQDGFEAFHDKAPSRSLDRRDAGVQRLGDPAVAPSLAGLRHVRFQKDASFRQQMRGALAPADKVGEPGALLFAQPIPTKPPGCNGIMPPGILNDAARV